MATATKLSATPLSGAPRALQKDVVTTFLPSRLVDSRSSCIVCLHARSAGPGRAV
jgi:hypothetical protein